MSSMTPFATNLKFHPKAFSIATLLAAHGYRKGSLSRSGAIGAFVVGYGCMGNDNPVFGVGLITFYALGTIATKYKASIKSTLEEGHSSGSEAGNRSAWQVLSNSIPTLVSSVAYRFLLTAERIPSLVALVGYRSSLSGTRVQWNRLSRGLVWGCLGHLACCLGDTLSSELGILSKSDPYLITTLRQVPPGTNGAVSLIGTGVSLLGGAGLGMVFWTVERAFGQTDIPIGGMGKWALVGAAAGLGGSLLDSILGATLQKTFYNTQSRKILTTNPSSTQQKELQAVSGLDVLSNNQVNFICGAVVAGVTGWMGWSGM